MPGVPGSTRTASTPRGDGIACESNPAPYYYGSSLPDSSGGQQTASGEARVAYVVDGDTIRLTNGKYVRLIGTDTPERGRRYYAAAKRHLDQLVEGRVRLVNPASTDDRDHHGRLLRYVHDGGRDTGLASSARATRTPATTVVTARTGTPGRPPTVGRTRTPATSGFSADDW